MTQRQHRNESGSTALQAARRHQSARKIPFCAGQFVYADSPPMSTYATDRMALGAYSKLPSCALGPYPIISTTSHTIKIDQYRIPNMISSDHALFSLQQYVASRRHGQRRTTNPIKGHPNSNSTEAIGQHERGSDEGSWPQEYTVDHIGKHVGNSRQRKYVLRSYDAGQRIT